MIIRLLFFRPLSASLSLTEMEVSTSLAKEASKWRWLDVSVYPPELPADVLRTHIFSRASETDPWWGMQDGAPANEFELRKFACVARSWRDASRDMLSGRLGIFRGAFISKGCKEMHLRLQDEKLAEMVLIAEQGYGPSIKEIDVKLVVPKYLCAASSTRSPFRARSW